MTKLIYALLRIASFKFKAHNLTGNYKTENNSKQNIQNVSPKQIFKFTNITVVKDTCRLYMIPLNDPYVVR